MAKKQPHLRLTAEEIRDRWLAGIFYKPAGYLLDLIRALRKDGWKLRFTVAEFCEEWQINERAFYRAKAELITRGLIAEKIHGTVELWIQESNLISLQTDKFVSPSDKTVSASDKTVSPSDKFVSASDKTVGAIAPEATLENDSSPPSDLLQLNSTLCQFPAEPPAREGDFNLENLEDCASENLIDGSKQKLSKQNSSTTIPIGDDPVQVPQQLGLPEISFLDWVRHYKASHAKNPTSYAKTCITRDVDGTLKAEYEAWLVQRQTPCFTTYQPEPFTPPDPEANKKAIAEAKEILKNKGLVPCP